MAQKEVLNKKLEELKTEYSKTKYNKATNKHLGILRAKISDIKKEIVLSNKKIKGSGFFVKKHGDATVALIGFPSVGKSSLINLITNANSKTAQYAFTTTQIIQGIMNFNNAKIQIIDTPGMIKDAHLGVGNGRTVIASLRIADLIAFVVDVLDINSLDILIDELKSLDIFINKNKPDIKLIKTDSNGIIIPINKSGISDEIIKIILSDFGIHNATISLKEAIDEGELIANISNKAFYIRSIIILNKIDLKKDYRNLINLMAKKYNMKINPISTIKKINIDLLKEEFYKNLDIMTIYLKPKDNKELDPIIVKKGVNVGNIAKKLHSSVFNEFKCAYITGKSVKFSNQKVGINHKLENEDIITFITK